MNSYKAPLLTTIFTILGAVVLVGAVLWVLFGILIASGSESKTAMLPAIGVALALVLTALIYFGVAQVIDYLGRTAYSTERLCHLLESSVVQSVKGSDKRLSSSKPILVRMDKVAAAPPSTSQRGGAVYHYSSDGTQEGPFTLADLKEFRSVGVLSDETPVFREGDAQWRTLQDHVPV